MSTIDEPVIHLSEFNNAAGGANESVALGLDAGIFNLNAAIAEGRVEVLSLSPVHDIDAVDGQLQGSGTTSAISTLRIPEAFTSFGTEETGAGNAAIPQIPFAFDADINSATVCFTRSAMVRSF